MNIFEKLRYLKNISGKITKEEFVLENQKDIEFMLLIKFLLDTSLITGVDKKTINRLGKQQSISVTGETKIMLAIQLLTSNNTGKDEIVKEALAYASGEISDEDYVTYCEILSKSLKLGMTVKSWNKFVPDSYKAFQPRYMGAISHDRDKLEKMFSGKGYAYSDIKMDGQFMNTFMVKGEVDKFTSRTGKEMNMDGCDFIKAIVRFNQSHWDYVLNGELTIPGIKRSVSNGMIARISNYNLENNEKKKEKLANDFLEKFGAHIESFKDKIMYTVWDVISLEDYTKGKGLQPYNARRISLKYVTPDISMQDYYPLFNRIESKTVTSVKQAYDHFSEALKRGEEGTIVKSYKGIWKDGKPQTQIKLKLVMDLDLEVIDFEEGDGKYKGTLGNIICKSSCSTLINGISGMEDKLRDEIWNNKEDYIGKIVKVECNGTSINQSGGVGLLHARFEEFRNDKDIADTWEDILDREKMKIELGEL